MAAMVDRAHAFRPADFVGGHPVLDFVNTVTARNAEPADWLDDYPALLRWALLSGLFAVVELPSPQALAPAAQRAELRRCKDLRDALLALLTAIAADEPAPAAAAKALQVHWRLAAAKSTVDFSVAPARMSHTAAGPGLTTARRVLVFAAMELLTTPTPDRLRICPGDRCGWLFLDTSKAGRRRWCDMATCGNAAKNHRRRRGDGSSVDGGQ